MSVTCSYSRINFDKVAKLTMKSKLYLTNKNAETFSSTNSN